MLEILQFYITDYWYIWLGVAVGLAFIIPAILGYTYIDKG